jgi:uncharacterized protein (DUF488 family)
MQTEIYTSGVYGSTAESFFEKLKANKIDTFVDIRRRRAVRGSQYAFANSNRLQAKLRELGINYIHIEDLSPTPEIIGMQKKYDKETGTSQTKRDHLSDKFISEYKKTILDRYDFTRLLDQFKELDSKRALLFCVEANAAACHRSLVADKLNKMSGLRIKHI